MLPTNVKPSRYTLTLEPDMEASSFLGHETIEVDVLASTSSITLNASELQISSCRILPAEGDVLQYAIPMCAPYSSLSTKLYRSRVKLTPAASDVACQADEG